MIHRFTRRNTWSASLVISLLIAALGPGTALAQSQPAGDQPAADQPAGAQQAAAQQAGDQQAPPGADQPEAQPPPAQPAPQPPPGTTPVVSRPATLFPAMGPSNELVLGDNFFIRPGLMLQGWSELLQDRVVQQPSGDDGGYQWNTYLRRARIFFAGGVFKKMTFLLLLEAANLGRTATAPDGTATKNYNSLTFQDALLSLNLHPAFQLQAGLMLVPFCRNILMSTATYTSLDVLTTSATYLAATQTSNLRDTGVALKGQVLADRLEYRLGVFQGLRQSSTQEGAAGGKNPFRVAGYLQYDFLDPESGYVFNGMYFGKKQVVGVSAGFDYQKADGNDVDAYWAASAAAFASIPLNGADKAGGDEVDALVQFLHFDPGTTLAPPPTGLAEQNDIAGEIGYYNKALKGSVFGKVELRMNDDAMFEAGDLRIFGGGLKYFIAESAANVTVAYNRIESPNAPEEAVNPANQLVMQLQLAYY
ncbi:MAG TPA: hypothetical protein VKB80_37285 [Kofleriaceae bacterium]|nr:hypothetical protein [Kofleriaceae bacterium]